jgi:hypothetical protein
MPTIAIYALSRSGSTLLNYTLTNSLPDCYNIFEPKNLSETASLPTNLVVKVVLDSHNGNLDLSSFSHLDKHIHLVRDPRDRLISSFLFGIHGRPDDQFQAALKVLEQKECAPESLAFIDVVLKTNLHMSEQDLRDKITSTQSLINTINIKNDELFTIRYEDLISGNLLDLEHHIDTDISEKAMVPERHAYAKRAATTGQWRDWFTPKDVAFFQPLLSLWLDQYCYTDNWNINSKQIISRDVCSEFVRRARCKKRYFEKQGIHWSDD